MNVVRHSRREDDQRHQHDENQAERHQECSQAATPAAEFEGAAINWPGRITEDHCPKQRGNKRPQNQETGEGQNDGRDQRDPPVQCSAGRLHLMIALAPRSFYLTSYPSFAWPSYGFGGKTTTSQARSVSRIEGHGFRN